MSMNGVVVAKYTIFTSSFLVWGRGRSIDNTEVVGPGWEVWLTVKVGASDWEWWLTGFSGFTGEVVGESCTPIVME
jgi:hypothetical protein